MGGAEAPGRDQWGSQMEFILSCLGYAVGTGNVVRFPYLCGRSGGAAFLIPYVIMMIFAGFPLFYMDLSLGQYTGDNPTTVYRRMAPLFSGLGYTMVFICVISSIYYNMYIAWAMRYFVASLTTDLPWSDCNRDWNTHACYDDRVVADCANKSMIYFKGECHQDEVDFVAPVDVRGLTENWNKQQLEDYLSYSGNRSSPGAEYNTYLLGLSDGLHDFGYPKWDILLSLFIAWVLVWAALSKGVKTAGKVVYFTATFPYVLLVILFFRGITLQGASKGLTFYLVPKWEKLLESDVWSDAANQIFFSLSVANGGLITLSSYNKFNNNIFRDTLIVVLGNCLTSFFAGFVIFSILGYVSELTGQSMEDLAKSGSTLAYIVYPEAISRMPVAPLWALLFFFMLILLGIDSQLVFVETPITAILDEYPSLRKGKVKMLVVAVTCLLLFLPGIALCCPAGPYLLDLLDKFGGGLPMVCAGIIEALVVSHIYGWRRFVGDIRLMLGVPRNFFTKIIGYPVNFYWIACWTAITPLLLTAVFIFGFVTYKRFERGSYIYPIWAEGVGWAIFALVISPVFIWALAITCVKYFKAKQTGNDVKSALSTLITPTAAWRPQTDPSHDNSAAGGGDVPLATVSQSKGTPYANVVSPGQPVYIPAGQTQGGAWS